MLALLVLLGSFSAVNFFNFTPWDFQNFLNMLGGEAIEYTGGNNQIENVVLYLHGSLSYLGLGSALFLLFGLMVIGMQGRFLLHENIKTIDHRALIKRLAHSPYVVFFSPFVVHFFLVINMEIHAARFMLPFVPILCFLAAVGFSTFLSRVGNSKMVFIGSLIVVFMYQGYNAIGLAKEFQNDIRYDAAKWIEQKVADDESVTSFSRYSAIKGVHLITGKDKENSEVNSAFFITCNLGYQRYFRSNNAKEIFHAYGGQKRLKFYRDLFGNKLGYEVGQEFKEKAFTLEQYLIAKGYLQRLDTYIPRRLFVFRKVDKSTNVVADKIPDAVIPPF